MKYRSSLRDLKNKTGSRVIYCKKNKAFYLKAKDGRNKVKQG